MAWFGAAAVGRRCRRLLRKVDGDRLCRLRRRRRNREHRWRDGWSADELGRWRHQLASWSIELSGRRFGFAVGRLYVRRRELKRCSFDFGDVRHELRGIRHDR